MVEKDIIEKQYSEYSVPKLPKRISFGIFFISAACFLCPLFWRGAGGQAAAQTLDSIRVSFHKRPHLIGGFASKNTFISGFRSPIYTARAGLDFNHTVRIGAGISWLKLSPPLSGKDNTPFYIERTVHFTSGDSTVQHQLRFRYIGLYFEYVYFKSKKWEFSTPIQLGFGDSNYFFKNDGITFTIDKHAIFLYEPAVSGQYKILKWFGVGLDVGYRIMIISNKNIGTRFNSPMYDIKAIIFWGELYNKIFGKVN